MISNETCNKWTSPLKKNKRNPSRSGCEHCYTLSKCNRCVYVINYVEFHNYTHKQQFRMPDKEPQENNSNIILLSIKRMDVSLYKCDNSRRTQCTFFLCLVARTFNNNKSDLHCKWVRVKANTAMSGLSSKQAVTWVIFSRRKTGKCAKTDCFVL